MQKLLFSFFLLLFCPLTIYSAWLCIHSINASKEEINVSIKNSFDQSYFAINSKLNYIRSSSFYFLNNSPINILTETDPQELTIEQQLEYRQALSVQFLSENFGSEISDTYVFLENKFPILEMSSRISNLDSAADAQWLAYALSTSSYTCFIPSYVYEQDTDNYEGSLAPQDCLSFVRKISSSDYYRDIAAIVRFDFKKSTLNSILETANCTPGSQTFIVNSQGELMAGSFSGNGQQLLPYLASTGPFESFWSNDSTDSGDYMLGSRQLENTDWYFISIIPSADILSSANSVGQQFIIFAVVSLVCVIVYIIYLSVSIINRIKKLAVNMHNYDSRRLNFMEKSKYSDEIGTLIDEYNHLIARIQELRTLQIHNEKELRNSEIRIIRAQMNPHFLYNTLEMLRWYANTNDKTMVNEIIHQLSSFYKLSLNHGQEFYTVSKEIQLLQAYFNLMNMRYMNTMKFEISADGQIGEYKMPIILLQPILENAIIHGILPKKDKSGTIHLSVRLLESDLVFEFSDNGVGMDSKTLFEINRKSFHYLSQNTSGNNIGVKNIANRISLLYGEKYGLTYSINDSGGTTVVVRIPAEN